MIPTEKRGWGAAQAKNLPTKVVDRYCISPQLAPPVLSPRDKKIFANTESYHEGRRK